MKEIKTISILAILLILFYGCGTGSLITSSPPLKKVRVKQTDINNTHSENTVSRYTNKNKIGETDLSTTSSINYSGTDDIQNNTEPFMTAIVGELSYDDTKKTNSISSDSCDVIIKTDGTEIEAKVLEVGVNEIKYRLCNNPDGPIYIMSKSAVFKIKHPNGTESLIDNELSVSAEEAEPGQVPKKFEEFSIASIISIVGGIAISWLFPGATVILLILGIIFGFISLSRIKKNPDKYKGKWTAIISIILGIIAIIAIIALIILVIAVIFALFTSF